MTTTASTLKLKTEISRITQILQANGVEFEEARRRARRPPPTARAFCTRRRTRAAQLPRARAGARLTRAPRDAHASGGPVSGARPP
jgi:hypothetical protein